MKKKELKKMVEQLMVMQQMTEAKKDLSDYISVNEINSIPESQKISALGTKIVDACEAYLKDNLESIVESYIKEELDKMKIEQKNLNKKIASIEKVQYKYQMEVLELKQEIEHVMHKQNKISSRVKNMRKIMKYLGEILYGRKAGNSLKCFEKRIENDTYYFSDTFKRKKNYSLFTNLQALSMNMLERRNKNE